MRGSSLDADLSSLLECIAGEDVSQIKMCVGVGSHCCNMCGGVGCWIKML